MKTDKQIEDMARVIEKMPWRIEQDGLGCRITNNTELAKYFYNAGYRKASDIIEEIEEHFNDRVRRGYIGDVSVIFAELKKKYESEGEG